MAGDYLKQNVPRDRLTKIILPKHLKTQSQVLDLTEDEFLTILGTFVLNNPENLQDLIQYPISMLKKLKKLPNNKLVEYNLIKLLTTAKFSSKQVKDLISFLPKNLRYLENQDNLSITFLLNIIKSQVEHMDDTQRVRVAQYCNWLIQKCRKFTTEMKYEIVMLTIQLQLMKIKGLGEAMDEDSDVQIIESDFENEEITSWGMKRIVP